MIQVSGENPDFMNSPFTKLFFRKIMFPPIIFHSLFCFIIFFLNHTFFLNSHSWWQSELLSSTMWTNLRFTAHIAPTTPKHKKPCIKVSKVCMLFLGGSLRNCIFYWSQCMETTLLQSCTSGKLGHVVRFRTIYFITYIDW